MVRRADREMSSEAAFRSHARMASNASGMGNGVIPIRLGNIGQNGLDGRVESTDAVSIE